MLKDRIEKSVQVKQKDKKEKEAQKKGEEKVPFQYSNELEISVYKNDELVEKYENK